MTERPDFRITEQERMTPLWKKLDAFLVHRLNSARERNDGNLDAVETAKLRGQIAEIKALLDLAKERPHAE